MRKKRLLSLLIVLLISYASLAQVSAIHLSLQEAITASASNNNAIKLSELDVQVARQNFARQMPSFYRRRIFLIQQLQLITR